MPTLGRRGAGSACRAPALSNLINQPGALEGWQSVTPPGYEFDNRITAGSGLGMLFYNAAARAAQVCCPLLLCVCDRENLIAPAVAEKVASDAPHTIVQHYDADHFTVYHPPIVQRVVADQIDFLTEHLA